MNTSIFVMENVIKSIWKRQKYLGLLLRLEKTEMQVMPNVLSVTKI